MAQRICGIDVSSTSLEASIGRDGARASTFDDLLALLKRQIKDLAAEIAALIEHDPLWREIDLAFRSIKGVAGRTVARVLAEMPEIGTLSHKSASKLAGLAPLANDSGKHQGRRLVRGGRSSVRERSSSSSPASQDATNRTSSPSANDSSLKENRPGSSASPSPTNSSSDSTQKPATSAESQPKPKSTLDKQDSR